MPRCGRDRLNGYGDSMVRSPAGCGDRVASPVGDIARMVVGDGVRLDSALTQWTRNDVTTAQGNSVRYR